jgi:hypothetical protein
MGTQQVLGIYTLEKMDMLANGLMDTLMNLVYGMKL